MSPPVPRNDAGRLVDESLRRRLGDEADDELAAMNCAVLGWCARKSIIVRPSCMPPLAGIATPMTRLRALIVAGGVELEAVDGVVVVLLPAGEAARQLRDVGLGVGAVHAQRVQLHHLAGVVLVDARSTRLRRLSR